MNINTTSYYSVSASTNKGMSGLVSGMDTESMVKEMLAGAQKKIDKQEALKQQTIWKQEIYHDVIKSINSFYSKYFDTSFDSSLETNLSSALFFDSMISKVKAGDAVNIISTDSSAAFGDISIAVKSLASAAALTGENKMSATKLIAGSVKSDEDLSKALSKTVSFVAGGTSVSVNLNNVGTEEELISAINTAFADAGVSGVTAKIYDGKLRIITNSPSLTVSLGEGSTVLGLQMTGLTVSESVAIEDVLNQTTGNMLQGGAVDLNAGVSFELSLDGVTKTITLRNAADSEGNVTLDSVRDALHLQIQKAFGNYVKVEIAGSGEERYLTLDLNIDQTGHELEIFGADARKLGFTPGDSTLIGNDTKLGELGAHGQRYSFTINGTDFTFDEDDTLGQMINEINLSDAGVKITYSTLSDTFRIEAASTGAQFGIDITQREGNLLNVILGDARINEGSSVAGRQLTTGIVKGNDGGLKADYTTEGASLIMNVNGKDYTFTLAEEKTYDKVAVETAFNDWLSSTFGQSDLGEQNIKFQNGDLLVKDGYIVQFAKTKTDLEDSDAVAAALKSDLALAFGFSANASSNLADENTLVSDVLQLQGLSVLDSSGNPALKMADISEINGFSVAYSGSRLSITGYGNIDLSGEPELSGLFGASSFTLSDGALKPGAVEAGRDALIQINGTDISRSGNTITIDGLTMELTKTSDEILDDGGSVIGYEKTVISTSRNADKIVSTMKSFVEDYNAMLDKLNGYLGEDANYREYPPLTSAQKDEMSDKEIELWEKKARQGLVRNDPTISDFLSQLRSILYTKPEGCKTALYSIGIETMPWESRGKLKFDEAAFRNAFAADADSIKKLFTDSAEGLAVKISSIINSTSKLSAASPGALVSLAGAEGWKANSNNNTLYYQIKAIESKLGELKDKYETERKRYWDQFNEMERIISYYSAQSSMISQQFLGY